MPRGYASPGPLFLAKRALRACRGGKCVRVNRRAPLFHAAVQTRRRAPGFAQTRSSRVSRGQMRPSQPPRALAPCHGGTRRRALCFWQSALFARAAGANASKPTAARSCPMPRGDASSGLLVLAKRALRACRGSKCVGQAPRALAACRGGTRRRALWFCPSALFAHVAGANAPGSTAARPCPMPRCKRVVGPLVLPKRALRACRGGKCARAKRRARLPHAAGKCVAGPLVLPKRTLRESCGGKCARVNRRAPLSHAAGANAPGSTAARSCRVPRGQIRPGQPPRASCRMPRGERAAGPLVLPKRALRACRGGKCVRVNRRALLPRAAGVRVAGPFILAKRTLRESRGGKCAQANRRAPLSHAAVQTRRRALVLPKRALRACRGGKCVGKRRALLPRAAGANAPGPSAARSCPMPRGYASPGPLFLATHYFLHDRGKAEPQAAAGRGHRAGRCECARAP